MSITRLTRPLIESVAKTVKPYGDVVELDFQRNNIDLLENLQPLSLTELAILNLSYNRLQTLQNLVPIATLKELKVSANSLVSINTPLPFPKLQLLDLSSNKIYQITAELPESLLELDLRGNLICTFESIAPIFKLHNLTVLDLRQNPIVDKYISNEAFYTYVTKFLPKLDTLNGEPIAAFRQATISQMQLSKAESRVDKSNAIYDLTESRVAGVISAISQASHIDNRSEVLGNETRPRQSTSLRTSSVHQHDPEVNIKIYSNYYDKGGPQSDKGQISDSQRMVNEHVILFRSPSNRRLSYSQINPSNLPEKMARSISQGRLMTTDNVTASTMVQQQGTGQQGVHHKHNTLADDYDIAAPSKASEAQWNRQGITPITVQRSRSFRTTGESVIREVQTTEPLLLTHAHPTVHTETQSLPSQSKSTIIYEQAPENYQSIDANSKSTRVEGSDTTLVTKLRRKCMEQELEIHRLNLELKAASEILGDDRVIPGLLSRDTTVVIANKLHNEGKLFAPTISGSNEYAKLLSQSDFSEIALLKAQIQSLEESICVLENDSIVTYPHPETEKPGQNSLPIALYSYRRKLFHTILAGTRQANIAKNKIAELQKTVLALTKQIKEKEELEQEADAKTRLQKAQLKDAELRKDAKQKTIEALSTELSQYHSMFEILSELHAGGDSGLVSFLQKNSVLTVVEMAERALDLGREKIHNVDQSVQAITAIISRQKLRIEALTDKLDDYEHKYSALLSEHEDLMSRYDALKDTYKNLQLEKIKLETDSLDNSTRRRPPCANFAVQVRPRLDSIAEVSERSTMLEDIHTLSDRTSITDMQVSHELPPSPSVYIGPGRSVQQSETSPRTIPSTSRAPTISAATVASQITRSIMQNSYQSTGGLSKSLTRHSTPIYHESSPNNIVPTIELNTSNKLQPPQSEEDLVDMKMAERKQLAAEMKELQSMTVLRSSSSNRKRAEKIMGMLSKLDSLM
ncbi:Hypothetical protein GLP15_3496 [Giardia lamblia P15]|uniref:Leucine-rich repeat protein n=1 Tax=Giardia intestinalis (strain P15) TaxID=658858 RepID=E1F0G5_GIAIA|nr:Hypothetical protein GLP15_3496 [Giardia lamblia P15]